MQSGFLLKLMASETRITLRYSGPSVDDGTLPIDDVVDALQGFAGAYGKVSRLRGTDVEHQLRVSAVRTGSFELVILAWAILGQTPSSLQGLEVAVDATRWVISRVFSLIEAKKHAKNEPFEINVKGNNNTFLMVNAQGASLEIPKEIVELIREKSVDGDLNKIVSPLAEKRIDSAEITAETENQPSLKEIVTSDEREYFRPMSTMTTKESEITGKFVSLNKENNQGTFELQSGKRVHYKYSGPNPDRFHLLFARKGPVRVEAIVTFDENLDPTQIVVKSATHLQHELPLDANI